MRFLTHAKLAAFRCYEGVELNLEHVNIFAGPNNSGKSALLRSIRRLASVDLNRHARTAERAGVGFWSSSTVYRLEPGDMRDGESESRLTLGLGDDQLRPKDAEQVQEVHARFHPQRGTTLWVNDSPEPEEPNKVAGAAKSVLHAIAALPVIVIPETRGLPAELDLGYEQDDSRFHEEVMHAGRLLPCLVQWACQARKHMGEFEKTASDLLGESVVVSVDPTRRTFSTRIGSDLERDVHSIGAGIVEALTLSAALTAYDRGLLLYEEPELHLHPRIQRRIIAHLRQRAHSGPWQVLLTTHSNHVLDCGLDEGVAVHSVMRAEGRSRLVRIADTEERRSMHALFDALGVRPSSALQPQILIWVEGPSDAIYFRFLLELEAPDLAEYVDFSFAFFGGALLTYQAASSTLVKDLIDLAGIHRNSFIVFDSDRGSEKEPLGKTYAQEFKDRSDAERLWITWGREMENYLRDEVVCWAAANSTPAECSDELTKLDRRFGVFSDQVGFVRKARGRERAHKDASDANKVNFARDAVDFMKQDNQTDWLDVGDLRDRLQQLVKLIRAARL